MGAIISRFRRKKTTTEILERLETQIKSIEQDDQCKEQTHKRVIGYVMAYSVGLYVVFAILYYYMYVGRSQQWLHSVIYASALMVVPILVIFIRATISWYYNWSLNKNRIKLNKMREEKKKILEEVMNTETYKVAKQILDKYGSPEEQSKALKPFSPTLNVPGKLPSNNQTPTPATPGQLRQRQLALASSTPMKNNMNVVAINNSMAAYRPRLRSDQLPRPLMDKNRSALDKVVDYILKDGPNYRMALICAECSSHNGMAMAEEFEYVSYVCAYCGAHNAARKQRPHAPRLAASPIPHGGISEFEYVSYVCAYCGGHNAARKQRPHAPRLAASPIPHGGISAITANGDDSSIPSSGSDTDEDKNDTANVDSDNKTDRPPSPVEEPAKSETEKKED